MSSLKRWGMFTHLPCLAPAVGDAEGISIQRTENLRFAGLNHHGLSDALIIFVVEENRIDGMPLGGRVRLSHANEILAKSPIGLSKRGHLDGTGELLFG